MKNTRIRNEEGMDGYSESQRILQAAYAAWMGAAPLRQARARNRDFTYGRQWGDMTIDRDGNAITEYERYRSNGTDPITNNMMRQMVKSVVGRFRTEQKEAKRADGELSVIREANKLDELDSRGLEEFLISGCCIQRVDTDERGTGVRIDNVNVNRFIVNAMEDVRCGDCEIVGELHDMRLAELILRVSRGDRAKARWIRELYSGDVDGRTIDFAGKIGANGETGYDFWHARNGKCRAIEVWTKESGEVARCHDRETAEYYEIPYGEVAYVERENKKRECECRKLIDIAWDIRKTWCCRWFTPMGDVIGKWESTYGHGRHPYAMKFYPLTDGEVHSFVEDVIDQQKYVNRLITVIDHIISSSAKGVLLYPDTGLPAGFTWDDIRRIWSKSNGIIPYSPDRMGSMPQQVSSNGTNIGAYEMLQLQMKLFEDISGVSGALQGKQADSTTGAELYKRQIENSSIALSDVYESYDSFRKERDAMAKML